MHYNEVNSYLFVTCVELYKFKTKDSEINATSLCLDNASIDFSAGNMKKTWLYYRFSADDMKKTGLYWYPYEFLVDYDGIDVDDFLDIHLNIEWLRII